MNKAEEMAMLSNAKIAELKREAEDLAEGRLKEVLGRIEIAAKEGYYSAEVVFPPKENFLFSIVKRKLEEEGFRVEVSGRLRSDDDYQAAVYWSKKRE